MITSRYKNDSAHHIPYGEVHGCTWLPLVPNPTLSLSLDNLPSLVPFYSFVMSRMLHKWNHLECTIWRFWVLFYCNIIIWRINASCVFSRLCLWLTNNTLQSECSAVCGTIHLLKGIWIPKVLTSRTKSSVNNSSVEFMNLGLHFSEINALGCKCWVIECLYIVVDFNKLMTNSFSERKKM